MDATMQEAKKPSRPVPAEISQALLPPIEIKLPDGKAAPLEPRFDLTVSNAPAREVFMGLVEGTPYSMVVHPDVKGFLSLNLKEVTVPEAVEAIRQVYGYEYRRDGGRFLILGAEMQTRIFTVNYLNVTRSGTSNVNVGGSGGIGGASTGTGTTTTTGTTTGSGGAASSGAVSVSTSSQSDFWKNLTTALTAIVGAEGGRKVVINPQTGLVVVRAMPDELRLVEDYLGVTHATVNRQVVLEAKVIEVELKNEFQSGVNWSLIVNNSRGQLVDTRGSLFGGGTAAGGGTGTIASAFGGVFSLRLASGDFSLLIDALKGQGEVQILSSPRVSTVNNQKAVIKVGGEDFFVTGVTSAVAATSTTAGSTPSVSLTSFFSGISLDVTPQIDEHNNIILHIHPSVSAVTEKTKSFSVSSETFSLPTAASTIQESDNIVRAESGQIIVIGGLMKEASTDEDASVPVLADVPLLGNLFKHKKLTRIKKELIILLKPTSINIGQDWDNAVGEAHERIKRLRTGS
ncbi:MAG: pilus (MSHA type) biogenesis protein MshL [Candidatus Muproteobacteria bacterium RBG_16_64_11]|uniref:Pilus (MSHA type) biogenesis protein MshL n=1 Tax=Candidatus Muproteobacteria bacterium RBG_16_64_11 TaxID=1817758 RepID=A0A1F6TCK6_9PROT|nr:MAG: pilus (MSHA type) biogenesis protein MshL [Candidatus Muproteobacteria bacterium RBG_16_64_11]